MNQNNLSGFNPINEHDYYSTRDSESMSTNETSQQTEVMVDGLQVYKQIHHTLLFLCSFC